MLNYMLWLERYIDGKAAGQPPATPAMSQLEAMVTP
jgi:hypothetical protein